jgi:hypothetical protein
MNHLKRIASPVVVLTLICAFIYVYFFYLRGAVPHSPIGPPPAMEAERNWEDVPPRDLRVVPVAGAVKPAEAPITPLNSQNVVPPPNPLDAQPGSPGTGPSAEPNPNAAVPRQPVSVPDTPFIEGHWIGLEVIPLTAAIAAANDIPPDVSGALIDEVTLLSAAVGLYAGDVITAVNGKRVSDLASFQVATKDVAQSNRASVSVYSGGKRREIAVFGAEPLGVAQMEGAPMIMATAKSPHPYYGACDRCHAIARNGFNSNQLLKDQGDSLIKVAPNIRAGTPAPHRNRGTCTKCHVVI